MPSEVPTPPRAPGRRVRAERVEVQRSRDKILAAAEAHYSAQDADPSMAQLAKLAGVGNATLYRRFASIDDVIRELYAQQLGHLQSLEAEVYSQPTAWDAIVSIMTGIIRTLQDHPVIQRLNRKMVAREDDQRLSSQWDAPLALIVQQAQADGTLRPDVNSNDITFAAFRIGGYANLPPNERDRVLGRQLGIILDGLRADGERTTLPGDAISAGDLQNIFRFEVANPAANPVD